MNLRHPLLLILASLLPCLPAQAQAQAFVERPDVQSFISDVARRNQLPEGELYAALAKATPLPRVIELIRPPSNPGIRSWRRYRGNFIDKTRISGGVKFWQEHQAALAEASKRTGVPAEIIVGIIGVETVYGRNTGNFNTLSALATLAFDYPPRADLFRRELEALFILAHEQGKPVSSYTGSYAGALGVPQFLPSSVRNFATDGDGDGKIDLKASTRDAIFSVAAFLQKHGWQAGEPIVMPAYANDPAEAQRLVNKGIEPSINVEILPDFGVRSIEPLPAGSKVTVVDLITPDEPTEYWLGLQNFYVITRYNRSSFYAMVVNDLAQAVKQAYPPSP